MVQVIFGSGCSLQPHAPHAEGNGATQSLCLTCVIRLPHRLIPCALRDWAIVLLQRLTAFEKEFMECDLLKTARAHSTSHEEQVAFCPGLSVHGGPHRAKSTSVSKAP